MVFSASLALGSGLRLGAGGADAAEPATELDKDQLAAVAVYDAVELRDHLIAVLEKSNAVAERAKVIDVDEFILCGNGRVKGVVERVALRACEQQQEQCGRGGNLTTHRRESRSMQRCIAAP